MGGTKRTPIESWGGSVLREIGEGLVGNCWVLKKIGMRGGALRAIGEGRGGGLEKSKRRGPE